MQTIILIVERWPIELDGNPSAWDGGRINVDAFFIASCWLIS